jgi:hypothetical protein
MSTDAVVFLDAETTRLDRRRRPWEIAMIRREHGGRDEEITVFVDIDDLELADADPESLRIGGFGTRHPSFGRPLAAGERLCSAAAAARLVQQWTAGAQVFGVVPSFDTFCLDELLHRHDLEPRWHFQAWDMAVFAAGFLAGLRRAAGTTSEAVSKQCGVEPPQGIERHTAMGDARWVQRWYDRIVPDPAASLAA